MIAKKTWKKRSELKDSFITELAAQTGLSPLAIKVCCSRGLHTAEAIHSYLNPSLKELKDPFCLQDMQKAVQRVYQALKASEKILIFADYDVDGTTGAALLTWIFKSVGMRFEVVQPNRFVDGYGLSAITCQKAQELGCTIVIAIDCGINAFHIANQLKTQGVDLIILDHHRCEAELPNAFAIIDPDRKDCTSGLKELCGCSLVFYFARALRSILCQSNWFASAPPFNLKQHLDLVVIATVCDLVPLIGDNHILMRHGLSVLKSTTKPGLRALFKLFGLDNNFTASSLGFLLGPMINAAGRMQSANLAYSLLIASDSVVAEKLAKELFHLNNERKSTQDKIWLDIREKKIDRPAVVLGNENWHEGVIGIVASRVSEHFKRPTVISSFQNGIAKASIRSYGKCNILECLKLCKDALISFGGHAFAAGCSLYEKNFKIFEQLFCEAVQLQPVDEKANHLWIEDECCLEDFTTKAFLEIESLGPFGVGNPEPHFVVKAFLDNIKVLKEKHIKGRLTQGNKQLDMIWFHALDAVDIQKDHWLKDELFWVGVPELNRYKGMVTPTLRLKDCKGVS